MKAYAIQFLIELIYRLGNIKINKKKNGTFYIHIYFITCRKALHSLIVSTVRKFQFFELFNLFSLTECHRTVV